MKEKLQEYALVAEIISALAIVLSLIFVGLQVRQGSEETAANTEAIRSQVRESMLNADSNILSRIMDYPYLVKNDYEPTGSNEEQQERAVAFFFTMVRSRENYWIQHKNGILDTDTYLSYRSAFIKYLSGSKFYLSLWERLRGAWTPGFVQEINGILRKKGLLP